MLKSLTKKLRKRLSSAIGLPNIYSRLDEAERRIRRLETAPSALDDLAEYLFLLEARIRTHQEVFLSPLVSEIDALKNASTSINPATSARIDDVQNAMLDFIRLRSDEISTHAARQIIAVQQELFELKNDVAGHLAQLRRTTSDLRAVTPSTSIKSPTINTDIKTEQLEPALYQAFEDRFRGSEVDIRSRQEKYVEMIQGALTIGSALDIGCGRGEWLDVLRGLGIDAYGIDSNPVSVHRCRERGLNVVVADALAHLATLSNDSLGAVTLFQVVEHVPIAELPLLMREILRVLKPGGSFVAEFPNIQSVDVGANTFWLDPTHLRPLHPLFVEFVAQEVGFVSTHLHYPSYDDGLSTDSTAILSKSAPDVALIALK